MRTKTYRSMFWLALAGAGCLWIPRGEARPGAVVPLAPTPAPAPSPPPEQPQVERAAAETGDGSKRDVLKRLDTLEESVDALIGTVDRVEEQAKRNRLQWSGSYRVVMNNVNLFQHPADNLSHPLGVFLPVASKVDKRYTGWVNRLRLTLSYDLTDNLRFYGQLAVLKFFNEIRSASPLMDLFASRYPRDTTLRVERAYFDWFILDWLVFSFGRISSSEGPPAELRENTVRTNTWGVASVEGEMDILTLTLHLPWIAESTLLRLIYFPMASHTEYSAQDETSLFRYDPLEDPISGLALVYEMRLPYLGENLFSLTMLYFPKNPPRKMSLDVMGKPVFATPVGENMGSNLHLDGLLELKNILGIGLDLFAAGVVTILKPTPDDGSMSFEPAGLPIEFGLTSYEEGQGSTNLGTMIYTGFRYRLPFFGAYAPKLGAEFNRGSKYHISWSSPNDLLIKKLGTKGSVWEVYHIQPLVPDHLFFRLGFLQQIVEYDGLYVGPTIKADRIVNNAYLVMNGNF